jgi:NAD(P)-dependent dehydrogenase (short-subunit alcohol dehydrogenase family)
MKLRGKCAIITGASLGLGRGIAEAFIREGAQVLLCARTTEPLEKAAEELKRFAVPGQKILWKTCDVSVPSQVEELAALSLGEWGGCDVLVNNAAIHGAKGPVEDTSWDEWRRTIEVNLFGVVLPCRAMIPQMKARGQGKIINLSGGGATTPRPFFSAYAAAKTAVVRFTETLAEELRPFHIEANAIAPGALPTRLIEDAIAAGPEKIGAQAYAEMLLTLQSGGDSMQAATELAVFLASAESDGITGKLISARWDDWKELPRHRDELAATDLYTLRRVIPKDRGKVWGERS